MGKKIKFSQFSCRQLDVTVTEIDGEWRYNGPAAYGPRHVRRSGHGPYWAGKITKQFAVVLFTKLRKLNIPTS